MSARSADREPRRCCVCDARLSRLELGHEAEHIRAEWARAVSPPPTKKEATDHD